MLGVLWFYLTWRTSLGHSHPVLFNAVVWSGVGVALGAIVIMLLRWRDLDSRQRQTLCCIALSL